MPKIRPGSPTSILHRELCRLAFEHLREEYMIDQRTAPYAALLLRVSLGTLFIAHLYWKFQILDGGLNKWWGNFASNAYPAFVPWYCISAEFVGALLLIPGIYTRWTCLYTLPLIAGAAHFWAVRKGFYFTGAGSELPIVWSIMLVVQTLLGDGAFAVVGSALPWDKGIRRAQA
jgi:putative oxidoreductase